MPTDVITDNTTAQNATPDSLYSGCEDIKIVEADPTINYSSGFDNESLDVHKFGFSDHAHSLLRFTGLSNIAASSTVSAATLYIYQKTASGATYSIDLRRVLQSWVEAQGTWNIYSTGNNWNTAGCLGAGTDRVAAVVGTSATIGLTTGAYYSVDCTSLVQDIIDGTIASDEGFHLERTDAGNDGGFKAFSSSRDTDGQRPELVVTYTTGGPTGAETLAKFERRKRAQRYLLTQ